MQLACPSCDSKFVIDPAALGTAGRKVRCGHCGHSWRAMPEPPRTSEPEPEIELEPMPPEPSPAPSGDPLEAIFEPAEEQPAGAGEASDTVVSRRPGRRWRKALKWRGRVPRLPAGTGWRRLALRGWALYAVVVVLLCAFVVLGRTQIIAWVPEAGGLYAAIGLGTASPASVLQLRDVRSNWRKVDGGRSLVIAGAIINLTDEPQEVPPLIATLVDPEGIELKRWIFSADAGLLPARGQVAFETVATDPPAQESLELNLNFVTLRP